MTNELFIIATEIDYPHDSEGLAILTPEQVEEIKAAFAAIKKN